MLTTEEIRDYFRLKHPEFSEVESERLDIFLQESLDELENYFDFFGKSFKKAVSLLAAHQIFLSPDSLDSLFTPGAIVKRVEGDIETTYQSSAKRNKSKFFPAHDGSSYGDKLDELYNFKLNDLGPAIFVI